MYSYNNKKNISHSYFKNLIEKIYKTTIPDHTIHKIFLDAFLVMIVSEFSSALSCAIDVLMVSNFLEPGLLAVHSMVAPFYGMVAIVSGLFATGTQLSISKLIGRGNFKKADNIFTLSMLTCLIICTTATGASFIFADQIAIFFGAIPEERLLFENVKAYFLGLSTGIIPLACNIVLSPVLQINGDKNRVKYALLLSVFANCAVNSLAIFIFDGGMFGIGIGTSISEWCKLFLYLLHFTNKKIMCTFRFRGIKLQYLKEIFDLGLSKATVRVCNTLRPLIINRWILFLASSSALAAVGVNNNIRDLFRIPETAVALSVMLIGGIFFGEQDKTSLKKLIRITMFYNLVINVTLSIIIFIFAPTLASIYVDAETEIHTIAVTCLRWTAAGLPFYAINEYFIDFMLGTERHKKVHLYTIFEKLIYSVLCAFVLGLLFGIKGVLASFSITEMCFFVHIFVCVWIKNRTFPKKLSHFMMLPADFEVDPNMTLEFSIHNKEEVTEISKQIYAFCQTKQIDRRRAYFTSLCAEELASNIVVHGFSDDKKHSLQIRFLYVNNDIILRLRDDCKLFDIREKYDTIDRKDLFSNIGIRLVMNIAKDVTYINTLNLNTTILRLCQIQEPLPNNIIAPNSNQSSTSQP